MKRIIHGLAAIIVAAAVLMLAGCSAETLMNAGDTLGKLSSAGFGTGGDVYVTKATATINSFIESYEDCLLWDGSCVRNVDPETGAETISGNLKRIDNSDKAMNELLGNVINGIQKARESKAADAELRNALNTLYKDYDGVKKSYKGQTIEWYGHVNVKDIANVITSIQFITGLLPTGMDLAKYNLPFPAQASDLSTILSFVNDNLVSISLYGGRMLAKIQRGGGGESKFDIKDLKYILDGIEKSVNGRKDVTVGDKISFCFLYDILQTALKVLDRYVEQHPDESDDTMFDSLTADWILGSCGAEVDKLMAELEVVSYIYDFNLDVAGLAGKILGK